MASRKKMLVSRGNSRANHTEPPGVSRRGVKASGGQESGCLSDPGAVNQR